MMVDVNGVQRYSEAKSLEFCGQVDKRIEEKVIKMESGTHQINTSW